MLLCHVPAEAGGREEPLSLTACNIAGRMWMLMGWAPGVKTGQRGEGGGGGGGPRKMGQGVWMRFLGGDYAKVLEVRY